MVDSAYSKINFRYLPVGHFLILYPSQPFITKKSFFLYTYISVIMEILSNDEPSTLRAGALETSSPILPEIISFTSQYSLLILD